MINKLDVEITNKRMIHDFGITENHIIFPDLPMEFSPEKVFKEMKGPVFRWDNNQPSRYGIMKKMCNQNSQIQWFELPNHWVFHYVNAWEQNNSDGQLLINMYACAHFKADIAFDGEHPFFKEVHPDSYLVNL